MELSVRTAPIFLTNSNDTTSKFVIKVCNHLFTLNFYITSSSRFLSHQFHIMKAPTLFYEFLNFWKEERFDVLEWHNELDDVSHRPTYRCSTLPTSLCPWYPSR